MDNAMSQDDPYEENFDQNPRDDSGDEKESEDYGESFLAPKSAFKGDLSPGTVHRVRIERALDEELELKCLGVSKDEPEETDNAQEEKTESVYE